MTEVIVGNAEQNSDSNAAVLQPSTSAGMQLRQAREAKQMSVQALASALKVPAYKLQALEEDRWEALTDSVFTRSLALGVCRFLRIPAEPVLAGLPKLEGTRLSTNPEGINEPFKEKSLRSLMSSSQEPNSGTAAKVAVALLIAIAGGAGLYFLPQWQASDETQSEQVAQDQISQPVFMPQTAAAGAPSTGAETAVTAEPVAENTVTTVVEPLTAALTAVSPAVSADAAIVAAPAIADAAAANVPSAEAQPSATSANVPSASAAAVTEGSSAQAAPANSAMLKFAATGESWVQVRDAQGRVVMEKILKAGDVYEEAAAGRPFQVVVGNAGVTKLEIDGATFDLAAAAKNNVARFEVK